VLLRVKFGIKLVALWRHVTKILVGLFDCATLIGRNKAMDDLVQNITNVSLSFYSFKQIVLCSSATLRVCKYQKLCVTDEVK